jgi:hypothetical protein
MNLFERIRDLDQHLFRNVPAAPVEPFSDLIDDTDGAEFAEALVATVSGTAADRHLHAVGFPFAHLSQSRFSDGTFAVWYGSLALETTLRETIWHWIRDQEDMLDLDRKHWPLRLARDIYRVGCRAALVDLVGKQAEYPLLISDDYSFCQGIGRRLHGEGHPGLLAPSARHAGGENATIFNPKVLKSSIAQPERYLYIWQDPELSTPIVIRNLGTGRQQEIQLTHLGYRR